MVETRAPGTEQISQRVSYFCAMAVPKKGEGWGLVGCSKEEQVQGRGQGRVGLAVGVQGLRFRGGRW